jgi:hypothetical protein
MAEIKSTMELVLEKTKNLSLSEQEKKALHQSEWTGKVRGWVQKYLDDAIGSAQMKSNLSADRKMIEQLRETLELELLDHIHLNSYSTNEKIFKIFREVLEMNPEFLVQAVRIVQKNLEQERQRHLSFLQAELQGNEISGSAVLPNLSKSKAWKIRMEQMEADLHEALRESAKHRSI